MLTVCYSMVKLFCKIILSATIEIKEICFEVLERLISSSLTQHCCTKQKYKKQLNMSTGERYECIYLGKQCEIVHIAIY